MMNVAHDTLAFERVFDATPVDLFQAYADPRVRERWSAPSPSTEVRIDEGDFCTGGEERGRCGAKGDLRWSTRTYYHLVVPEAISGHREGYAKALDNLALALQPKPAAPV